MCALAELFVKRGGNVSGCDLRPGSSTDRLRTLDVQIHKGHEASHVEGAAALVVSAAVPKDHPEVQEALQRGIPVFKRAEALGQWVNQGRVLAGRGYTRQDLHDGDGDGDPHGGRDGSDRLRRRPCVRLGR